MFFSCLKSVRTLFQQQKKNLKLYRAFFVFKHKMYVKRKRNLCSELSNFKFDCWFE